MKSPVFIIGCPRSGTTILLDVLSAHESFAWISMHFNILPRLFLLNIYNRIYDIPSFGNLLFLNKKKISSILPEPAEPWIFWNTYLSKFQWERGGKNEPRRRTKKDITSKEIKDIRMCLKKICTYQKKDRFLSKYTDFPRIVYLTQAFPDAKFIHILRDPRATIYSYYNKIRSGEFKTWDEREWWIRGWPESWQVNWKENHNSQLSLAAYQWKFFVTEIWEDAKYLPGNQYLEVQYEDLIESPQFTIRNILNFCDLEFTQRIERYLSHIQFSDMNYKWKKRLNNEQKKELEKILIEDEFRRTFKD